MALDELEKRANIARWSQQRTILNCKHTVHSREELAMKRSAQCSKLASLCTFGALLLALLPPSSSPQLSWLVKHRVSSGRLSRCLAYDKHLQTLAHEQNVWQLCVHARANSSRRLLSRSNLSCAQAHTQARPPPCHSNGHQCKDERLAALCSCCCCCCCWWCVFVLARALLSFASVG